MRYTKAVAIIVVRIVANKPTSKQSNPSKFMTVSIILKMNYRGGLGEISVVFGETVVHVPRMIATAPLQVRIKKEKK